MCVMNVDDGRRESSVKWKLAAKYITFRSNSEVFYLRVSLGDDEFVR